jgi:carnitine 3-dehydrogenase
MTAGIRTVAIVGSGVIGAGWAARCLSRGLDVIAWDPAPGAEARLRAAIARAAPALENAGHPLSERPESLRFVHTLAEAVKDADFVQENAPEREDLKQSLIAEIDAHARPDVIIATSTSGLLPSRLQERARRPERVVVGHPFNPVYLLPLVEVVGGKATSLESIEHASRFYRSIGMRPLHVRTEIEGFVADRLMEALWREALWMVKDGVATTEEIDAAVIYGCGLRWSLMGTFLTFHLAGGEGGMRHMLHQFGPALKLPWTKLEAPELTEELIDRVADGCEEQAAGRSIGQLEHRRDEFLVKLLSLVKEYWPEAEGLQGRI